MTYHFLHPFICGRSSSTYTVREIWTANSHFIHNHYDSLIPAHWKSVLCNKLDFKNCDNLWTILTYEIVESKNQFHILN